MTTSKEQDQKAAPVDNFVQGRSESAGLVVAFVFGIFGVLTLLQTVQIWSVPWIILSLIYALAVLGTFFSFRGWAWNAIIADKLTKKSLENNQVIRDAINEERNKHLLMKIILPSFSTPTNGGKVLDRIFIPVTGMIIPVMGTLLWLAIALHLSQLGPR